MGLSTDDDLLCGFGRFAPKFVQRFAKIPCFVLCLSLFSMMQGMLVNGLVSASIPHLEREFGMTSTESGMILASNDISGLLLVLVISYYGENGHKPRWLGWGSILTGIGMLLFSLPKFIKGTYKPSGETLHFRDFETCNLNRTLSKNMDELCVTESSKLYFAIFCIANMLAGAGTAPLFTLGATYLDENVPPKKSPLFIGIWYATTLLGPSLGYFVAGIFLEQWVDPDKTPNMNVTSPLWVGRWWLPYITLSWVLLLVGVLLMMFPKRMPAADKIRKKAMENGDIPSKSAEFEKIRQLGFAGFAKATIALVTNKFLIAVILGATAKVFLATGIGPFYSKILVLKFNADPSTANSILGALLLLASTFGLGIGSVIMNRIKVKRSVKAATLICLVVGSSGILNALSLKIPGCSTTKLYGVNHIVTNNLSSTCTGCGCADTYYNPVCSNDVTYFSPCFAGCKNKTSNLIYLNCSCGHATIAQRNQTRLFSVKVGKCDQGCKKMIIFVSVTTVAVLISFIAGTPQNIIILRSVPENQRSFAMGLNYLLLRALGMLPGPIIIGKLLDSTCLVWKYDECGRKQNCAEYKIPEMSNSLLGVMFAATGVSTIFYLLAFFLRKKDDDEKQQKETEINGNTNEEFETSGDTHL